MVQLGFLSGDVTFIPFWPAGYPTFIAAVYRILSIHPLTISVIQILLLAPVTWLIYRLTTREFDTRVAITTATLLSINPALLFLPSYLMYETLLLSGLALGTDLLSRAAHIASRRLLMAAGAGITLGLTATIQPKVLLGALFGIVWLFARTKAFVPTVACAVALTLGPLLLSLRSDIALGHFKMSTNVGVNMWIGFNDLATGGYSNSRAELHGCSDDDFRPHTRSTTDQQFRADTRLMKCAVRWISEHPVRLIDLSLKKIAYFWSPMIGPIGESWLKQLDWRLLLPHAWTSTEIFNKIDFALRAAWTAASLSI
ncbi:MAG: glycosyltransferase family 39 protein, partial [Actinobacteria bacterium]|nr:glycosyltransferase family 39 protein [Actinomycetota bacterium]